MTKEGDLVWVPNVAGRGEQLCLLHKKPGPKESGPDRRSVVGADRGHENLLSILLPFLEPKSLEEHSALKNKNRTYQQKGVKKREKETGYLEGMEPTASWNVWLERRIGLTVSRRTSREMRLRLARSRS